jgi:radical SAM protein with 4Fe4S-binding SPASM domain
MTWHGLYSVTWNITSQCNFSCKHCYVPVPRQRDLTTQEGKRLLDEFADFGVERLYVSGGEPLLRKDLFVLLKHAVDAGLQVDTITNGWTVTKKVAQAFKRSGIDHVSVSVDGIEKTHDRFRNKSGSFERCMRAIELLKEAGVKVYLSPTISRHNLDELPSLLSLAEELGVNFSIKLLVPIGRAQALGKYRLNPGEVRQIYEFIVQKRREVGDGFDISTTCNPYSVFLTRQRRPRTSRRIRGGCTGGITLLCISADGNLMPCSRLQLVLGNVRRDSLMDVWYSSEVLDTLRNRDNLKGKCSSCKYKNWCGGCRAMAWARHGDYLAEDPNCWID